MSNEPYYPGQYIHDMHDGESALIPKLQEKRCTFCYRSAKFEIHSEQQRQALILFLDATRRLYDRSDMYMNKMLMACDENTAVYMYDNQRFGFVTF